MLWCQNIVRIRQIPWLLLGVYDLLLLFTARTLSVLLVIFQRHLTFCSFSFRIVFAVCSLSCTFIFVPSTAAATKIFCHCQMQHLIREWTIDTKIIKHNLLQPTARIHKNFVRAPLFPLFLSIFVR